MIHKHHVHRNHMVSVLAKFKPNIGNFFPVAIFQILKKPTCVKNCPLSEYAIFIFLTWQEVPENSFYCIQYNLYGISYMYADHHRRNKWVSEDWNGISANLSEWSRDQNGQYNIAIVMLVVGNVTPVTYHSQKLPFAKIIQWYYSFKLSISITGCYSTLDCLPSCQHSSRCTELILQFRIGSSDVSLKWRSFYFLWRNDLVSSFT